MPSNPLSRIPVQDVEAYMLYNNARWAYSAPVLHKSAVQSLSANDDMLKQFPTPKAAPVVVHGSPHFNSQLKKPSASVRSSKRHRYSWTRQSVGRTTSDSATQCVAPCAVRHRMYCPLRLAAKHVFCDLKVARRFGHLHDGARIARGARSGGAFNEAGDLNDLRQQRQSRWDACECGFEELKEPSVGERIVDDIFSVIDGAL
jgi:hypothetical protein